MRTLEFSPGLYTREARYAPGSRIDRHVHPWAYIAYVVDGAVEERCAREVAVRARGAVRIMPAHTTHANVYPASGARCLVTELHDHADQALRACGALDSITAHAPGSAVSTLAQRMYLEYCRNDDLTPLAVDGLLRQLLASAARPVPDRAEAAVPLWLRRVRERLHDDYQRAPSLADLAADAGVSTSHLVRAFRKHFRTRPAEYLARLRIDFARHALAHTDVPLARIACDAGFSDQAHFTRRFKECVGTTPYQYRLAFRNRGSRPASAGDMI
jgi:AraC family transcriptional regulator